MWLTERRAAEAARLGARLLGAVAGVRGEGRLHRRRHAPGRISGRSFATCWSSPGWPTIRALPTNADARGEPHGAGAAARSDLPAPAPSPIGSTRLRAADVPAAPVNNLDARFRRAAGRRARDDRRIRSSARSAKCGCRATRSRCGHGGNDFPAGAPSSDEHTDAVLKALLLPFGRRDRNLACKWRGRSNESQMTMQTQ